MLETAAYAAKRTVAPAATALLLASALSANTFDGPDFSQLSVPRRDSNVPPRALSVTKPREISGVTVIADPRPATNPPQEKKTEHPVKSVLGQLGAVLGLAGAGFYIAQTIKNGATTKMGWAIVTATEGLIAATSYYLGTRDNLWVPVAFTIGAIVALGVALKFGKDEPLELLDRIAGVSAVAGLWAFVANVHNPIVAAITAQVAYQACNYSFGRLMLRSPNEITKIGQALYLASATLNLLAMSGSSPAGWISPVGYFAGILGCTVALGVGLNRSRSQNSK